MGTQVQCYVFCPKCNRWKVSVVVRIPSILFRCDLCGLVWEDGEGDPKIDETGPYIPSWEDQIGSSF